MVLAAGANTRLSGLVPAYMKPLITVNGLPLILHAHNHAIHEWHVTDIVYVVSPDNVRLITQVIPKTSQGVEHTSFLVQPEADGVVDAIRQAMPLVVQPWTLILCADNTFDTRGKTMPWPTETHTDTNSPAFFGSQRLSSEAAKRFTRYTHSNSGLQFIEAVSEKAGEGVWIGPMFLHTSDILSVIKDLKYHFKDHEVVSVVAFLNAVIARTGALPLNMRCSDLGIPQELP